MHVSGNISVALGADTKIIAKGKCNHPNKRSVNEEYLKDKLPIPESAWTHCVFYRTNGCIFGGDCEYRLENNI